MIAIHWLVGIALLAVPAAPAASQPPEAAPDAARKLAACEGERFEFKAGDDARPTRITLCSNKGATTAELVRMFESAVAKIEQLDKLPPDRRSALVAQIRARIVEVQARTVPVPPLLVVAPIAATPIVQAPSAVASFPPLAPRLVPPLPARPRLTVQCLAPGETGAGGRCGFVRRDTRLAVRADSDLPAGTSLRFLRKGKLRSELALAPMRSGQSLALKLPQRLCAGVVASRIEIEVVQRSGASGAGQVVETLGPFQLRC